jgi:UrcA family protein
MSSGGSIGTSTRPRPSSEPNGEGIMKALTALTSAAVLTLTCGGVAYAQSEPASAKVSYADLDLSRATARQVLERRVELAVTRVCPSRPLPNELRKQHTYRTCRATAWTGARQQLAAIYNGHQLAQQDVKIARRAD